MSIAHLCGAALTVAILAPFAASEAQHQVRPSAAADPVLAEAGEHLSACVAFVEQKKIGDAMTLGRSAEALYRKRLERDQRNVEAMVGAARAMSQCMIPGSEMMAQGELSSEAIALLENALAIQPAHWLARFTVASINLRSPEFLGRAPAAAAHFDELLRQQGDRNDNPRFARVFEYRGGLFMRAGQRDSARVLIERGSRLFPADTVLREMAKRAASVPIAPSDHAVNPAPAKLGAVKIVASASSGTPSAVMERGAKKAEILAAPGGAADVWQAVQTQAGATHVTEGSDIHTRGGDPSETALLVNGGRIPSLSRYEGLGGGMFGAIESFVVREVKYSSGAFSARHGNALSGVVEIETDGRPRERQMRAGMSLVQASGTVRVPTSRTAGVWMNARVSQTAALLAAHGRASEFQGSPRSVEAMATFTSEPSPGSQLQASAIVEEDEARPIITAAGWTGPFKASGGARSVLLNSRWLSPNSSVVVRGNVTASERAKEWNYGVLSLLRRERGGVARGDVEWSASELLTMRVGAEQAIFSRSDSGSLPATSSAAPGASSRQLSGNRETAKQTGGYTEMQLSRNAMSMTAGVRVDRLPGESRTTIDPRVNVAARYGDWTARAGVGVFHQGRWRATPAIPDASAPSGTPGVAKHLVGGIAHTGTHASFNAEAFTKHYGDHAATASGPQIRSGVARGVDVMATARPAARVSSSLSYGFIDSELRLVDGRAVRSPFDVTHSATAATTVTVGRDWSVGTTLRYGTGAPRTPVVGRIISADGSMVPRYGALMSASLPAYTRQDVRVMRYVRTPRFLLTSFVELLNLADRHNVSGVTYDAASGQEVDMHAFFARRTVVFGGEFQFR